MATKISMSLTPSRGSKSIMADFLSAEISDPKKYFQIWSCYTPLEAKFQYEQKTQLHQVLKTNKNNFIDRLKTPFL